LPGKDEEGEWENGRRGEGEKGRSEPDLSVG